MHAPVGLLCPPPGDLPYPGIELKFLMSPELTGRFFTTITTWEAQAHNMCLINFNWVEFFYLMRRSIFRFAKSLDLTSCFFISWWTFTFFRCNSSLTSKWKTSKKCFSLLPTSKTFSCYLSFHWWLQNLDKSEQIPYTFGISMMFIGENYFQTLESIESKGAIPCFELFL